MTNKEIYEIAVSQSAIDMNCRAEDFFCGTAVVVPSVLNERAKKYYTEPLPLRFCSYGSTIVMSVKDEFRKIAEEYAGMFEPYRCFEMPGLRVLDERLRAAGMHVCSMAEYYLPDVEKQNILPCKYETRILKQSDFAALYKPEWSNALCAERKELDVLGVGAYDRGTLVGLAGCSADCASLYQIGVDVLPGYRRNGIASSLTTILAAEIFKIGKIPFYCSAWSNIRSVRNALKSGFVPAWVELSAKPSASTAY